MSDSYSYIDPFWVETNLHFGFEISGRFSLEKPLDIFRIYCDDEFIVNT